MEFLRRFSQLIAPPRLHLIRYLAHYSAPGTCEEEVLLARRYAGALGPRHRLRPWVTLAARESVPYQELLAGAGRAPAAIQAASAMAHKALGAAARTWAACMRKVFEVAPILCPRCAVEMKPVAVISDDCELRRLLEHLRLLEDFPKTAPARSPPAVADDGAQADPGVEAWDGIDEGPQPDWAAA